MRKVLCLVCVVALGLTACSKNKKDNSANGSYYNTSEVSASYDSNTKSAKDAKYQIIDQEFDNMLASASDYDAIPAYELQACDDSYLPLIEPDCCGKGKAAVAGKAKVKAKAQATATSVATTRAKKITNTTNIYYVDGNQTVPVSSSTTTRTVYKNGRTVSSSSSSSTDPKVTKTVNADGSVTTTTTYNNR